MVLSDGSGPFKGTQDNLWCCGMIMEDEKEKFCYTNYLFTFLLLDFFCETILNTKREMSRVKLQTMFNLMHDTGLMKPSTVTVRDASSV